MRNLTLGNGKKVQVIKGEKVYTFNTIDQDGAIESYVTTNFSLKEAKKYRDNIVGNSRCGEQKSGRICLVKENE